MSLYAQKIEYYDHDTILEGYYAYHQTGPAQKPAVIIAHDWSGHSEFVRQKAEQLAELGYVGFALDMYGKNKFGNTNEEKAALMQPFMQDREKLRTRILAAFETVKKLECVNPQKIGAMGFCFGGLCVLDLARSDVGIQGVVSLHGILSSPAHSQQKSTRTHLLILHGHDDPMVPPEQVAHFEKEMTDIGADWQMHIFSHTKHAFTNPKANDPSFGTVYHSLSDKRSWVLMKSFFEEMFNAV